VPTWDARQYLKFEGERTQPVFDLLNRLRLADPQRIIDLGCGPGNSTQVLRRRFPESEIIGLDSSPEMIGRARREFPEGLWQLEDVTQWKTEQPFDLVFSNAMLQWVPDHEHLLPRLLEQVAPGGALAAQIPAHYDSPLHREIIEVSHDPRWTSRMEKARTSLTNRPPAFYYDLLAGRAAGIDIWETTYQHVVPGPTAVLEWFRGTGLRPYLEALSTEEERSAFEADLNARYAASYPRRANGCVLFPFRRLFLVVYR
jgi:trans-aconitate 2-methyltransferase